MPALVWSISTGAREDGNGRGDGGTACGTSEVRRRLRRAVGIIVFSAKRIKTLDAETTGVDMFIPSACDC